VKSSLVLTPRAKADLRDILLDIAADSPRTAERLRIEFQQALRALASSPGIGHYHEELLSKKYRFWNCYRYVIVYEWAAKPLRIIAIVHGARDLAALLSSTN
jgi:toxin ParE1/3/4